MTLPTWTTIGLFVALLAQLALSWTRAKHNGKSFRSAVLPNALMAGGVSIILIREFLKEIPIWIDATLVILVSIIMLLAVGLLLLQLKRYLKNAWNGNDQG